MQWPRAGKAHPAPPGPFRAGPAAPAVTRRRSRSPGHARSDRAGGVRVGEGLGNLRTARGSRRLDGPGGPLLARRAACKEASRGGLHPKLWDLQKGAFFSKQITRRALGIETALQFGNQASLSKDSKRPGPFPCSLSAEAAAAAAPVHGGGDLATRSCPGGG